MPQKIALPEREFLNIAAAARLLEPDDQASFFMAVADQLEGRIIGPGSVGCAIRSRSAQFKHPNVAHAPHSSKKRC